MRAARFWIGLMTGLCGLLAVGEIYARYQPAADIIPFLGERSPLSGPFRFDPQLGADYISFETLRTDYDARLAELDPFKSRRSIWLWFGNSFVQAPEMLGDTAQTAMPDRLMVYLRRNEPLYVRAAQLRQLLAQGLRVERVVFVILPIDLSQSPRQPIASIAVTSKGAIGFQPRLPPPPFDRIVAQSRLALLGWVRSGRHYADPSYRPEQSMVTVSPYTGDDIARILGVLATVGRDRNVPITVVTIPNREQIRGRAGFALQDAITEVARSNGLDVWDARYVFDGVRDKTDIFLPDSHFNRAGNDILFAALRKHLDATSHSFTKTAQ